MNILWQKLPRREIIRYLGIISLYMLAHEHLFLLAAVAVQFVYSAGP